MQQKTVIIGSSANIMFTAQRDTKLSLTIILPGSHLPVRIRGVRFLIVDQQMDEVLLGRPLLKELWFDLVQPLEQVWEQVQNKQVENLEIQNSKLFSSTYCAISYRSVDDDPVPFPEGIPTGFGI